MNLTIREDYSKRHATRRGRRPCTCIRSKAVGLSGATACRFSAMLPRVPADANQKVNEVPLDLEVLLDRVRKKRPDIKFETEFS